MRDNKYGIKAYTVVGGCWHVGGNACVGCWYCSLFDLVLFLVTSDLEGGFRCVVYGLLTAVIRECVDSFVYKNYLTGTDMFFLLSQGKV